ncbi:hypothetical protein FPV67DRAFT_1448514 [Lyophyllum atratum]|nr:hypothetical protein FPV67DRAFT_1448514 [Lyophyllum atratum]
MSAKWSAAKKVKLDLSEFTIVHKQAKSSRNRDQKKKGTTPHTASTSNSREAVETPCETGTVDEYHEGESSQHGRHQAPSSISRELPAARNHNLNQRRELVNASDEIKALKKRHAREVLDVGEVLRSCQEDMKRERREVSSLKAKLVMQSTAGHLTLTMQDQRYLGNSLSGDSKTLMLFTLSPLVGFVDDPAVRREGEWQDDWDGEEVKLQTTQ